MKKFYWHSLLFWFVLLVVAILNAVLRETTYKPILIPVIGTWAHQISSLTGVIAFFIVIYLFLKWVKAAYTQKDLLIVGTTWIGMTILFETWMNVFVRHLSLQQVLETYYFWRGELWLFVLLSFIVSPLVADKIIKRNAS